MKKILALLLVVLMILPTMAACGGGKSGQKTVSFMFGGNAKMAGMYTSLIKEFNATKGKELGITVKANAKSGSLDSILAQQLSGNNGPDVVALSDEYFKKHTKYLEDLTGQIDAAVLEDFYPDMVNRYYYNISTTTSNSTDPLYGVPVFNDTTVLYYNKTALEAVGVICISVPEADLDAFNSGAADLNGKTKADYGISVTVPAKGYYRSESPYVPAEGETNGSSWIMPSSSEVLIFNDQIAMNWDETEDLGLLCTKERNSGSKTQYGYYTEWWFNYGWSVGGDCLEDLSGQGDWTYALQSDIPNYIVGEGKTYKGLYTGTVYNAGETLDLKDILEASAGAAISYETDSKTYFNYTANGEAAGVRDFSAELANGTLAELPSTYEAFSRFVYLAGIGGLNVCPYPSAFNGTTSVSYFTSGTLALLVERISNYDSIEKTMADQWSYAPLPTYKVYEAPQEADNDTVVLEGKAASHSFGYCVSVNQKSEVKDAAITFVNWLATDGQKFLAEDGNISSRQSDAETATKNLSYKNPAVLMSAVASAQAGDWWYMPDRTWIETWSQPLNNKVRYGEMTLEAFIYAYIEETNQRLREYKR